MTLHTHTKTKDYKFGQCGELYHEDLKEQDTFIVQDEVKHL